MTEQLTPKAPADTVAYVIPWRQQLAHDTSLPPDFIQTLTLTVVSGSAVVASSQNLGLAIQADISGGLDGETSTFACQVTTYGGQILNRTLTLLVSSGAVSITPETTSKRQVIGMAFEELGLADYEFNTTNEEKASALRRLDSLMALWAGPGFNLDLGYNFPPAVGGGNLSDPAGVPDSTLAAVSVHLAQRLAPIIGKALSPETRTSLNRTLNALRAQYAVIPDRILPTGTIVGAGLKPRSVWRPFVGNRVNSSGPNVPLAPLLIFGSPSLTVPTSSTYLFVPTISGAVGTPTFFIVNPAAWMTFNTATGATGGTTPSAAETDSNILIGVTDQAGRTVMLPQFNVSVVVPGTNTGVIGFDFGNPNQLWPVV